MAESNAFARRTIKGGSAPARLAAGISAADLSVTGDDLSTWAGLTANGPARVMINRAGATAEEVEISAIVGNTLTVSARGVGGTSAASHQANETIEVVSSPRDFDEANYWVAELGAAASAADQILVTDADNSLTGLSVAASRIVGRKAAGGVDDLTAAEVFAVLGSGTPSATTFLRGDGAWTSGQVGDLSDFQFVRKTADEGPLTGGAMTTLQDDDALLSPLVADGVYQFEATIFHINGGTVSDIKIAFTVPAAATLRWSAFGYVATSTVAPTAVISSSGTAPTETAYGAATSTEERPIFVRGLVVNGANAGNLQLQWAAQSSDASGPTVKAQSHLIVRRVA